MIDDSLPTSSTVDLAMSDYIPGMGILRAYSITNIARSGGGVVFATKTVRQKKIDGLAAPFSGCKAGNKMCKAQSHIKR